MATKIVTKNSSTAGAAPTATDLVQGELAVNVADKRLYTEDNAGAIVELGTNPSTIDINAGTIDGATVGASSASTGAFTTLTATGAFTSRGIDDNADATAITIDSSENVGIGTSSPTTALDARGGVNSAHATFTGQASRGLVISTANTLSNDDAVVYNAQTAGSGKHIFQTAGTERMRIDSAGKVGIGTTAPLYNVDLLASSAVSMIRTNDTTSPTLGLFVNSGSNGVGTISLDNGGHMTFDTGANGAGQVERMRIDASGNVGIGVVPKTGGSTWQHVQFGGTGNLIARKADNTVDAMFSNNYYVNASGADSYITTGAAARMFMNDNVISFDQAASGSTDAAIGWSERMRISSAGNVGIGTSSPQYITEIAKTQAGGTGPTLYLHNTADNAAVGHAAEIRFNLRGAEATTRNAAIQAVAEGTYGTNPALTFLTSSGDTGSATERMRIDSSGILNLTTANDTAGTSKFLTFGTNSFNRAGIKCTNAATYDGSLEFYTGNASNFAERMRMDASGNLLVGKTSAAGQSTAGIEARGDGVLIATKAGTVQYLNRTGSDGTILNFAKDGTTVGSIAASGGDILIGTGDTAVRFVDAEDSIVPFNTNGSGRDNAINLGKSSERFKDLHLSGKVTTGSITTDNANTQFNKISRTGAVALYVQQGDNTNDILQLRSGNGQAGTGTQRVTVTASGNLLVGRTSAPVTNTAGVGISQSTITVESASGSGGVWVNRIGSDGRAVQFTRNNVLVGYISVNGTTTTYATSSDQRLKENIADADDAGSKIDAIQVRKYDWKADGSHQDYGMVAQELQTVAPEAVSVPEDSEEMMGVDYSKLVPMLIKEIQSLRNRVAQLETGE